MPLLLGFGPAAAGCLWESGSRASAVQGGMLPYFGLGYGNQVRDSVDYRDCEFYLHF